MSHDLNSVPADQGEEKHSRPKVRPSIPPALTEVALVDATTCAAAGGMGVSWWHSEVAAGRAPQPVIRAPRCTRWTLASIKTYWAQRAISGSCSHQSAKTVAQAKKASAAARAKRLSQPAPHTEV